MKYPRTLQNLIECFQKLPGIGEKTAERLALSTLKLDQEVINVFSESLKDTKIKIKKCSICNNYSEDETCEICRDSSREQDILCVVEDPKNIIMYGDNIWSDVLMARLCKINSKKINEKIGEDYE